MIEARGLVKHYRSTPAMDNLSFDVRPGMVTGFLGPNGTGTAATCAAGTLPVVTCQFRGVPSHRAAVRPT